LSAAVGLFGGFVGRLGVEDAFAETSIIDIDVESVFFGPSGDGLRAFAAEFVVGFDGADGIGEAGDVKLHHNAVVFGLCFLNALEGIEEFGFLIFADCAFAGVENDVVVGDVDRADGIGRPSAVGVFDAKFDDGRFFIGFRPSEGVVFFGGGECLGEVAHRRAVFGGNDEGGFRDGVGCVESDVVNVFGEAAEFEVDTEGR